MEANFAYQCCTNHIDPYKLLPGNDANGVPWAHCPPPKCPHCHKTVDDALRAHEEVEWAAATTIAARNDIIRRHAKEHAGGTRSRAPILPMDSRDRSRGVLHRRMNVASNCMLATFLRT